MDWFRAAAEQSGPNRDGVIAGAPQTLGLTVTRDAWRQAAEDMAAQGARLLSLWASPDGADDRVVRAAYIAGAGVLVLRLPLPASDADYPGIDRWFPSASRMQRAVADLSGLPAAEADMRPWLRHAAWPRS